MPEVQTVSGVAYRTFRDASDYRHLARIITACARGEGDDRVETVERIASRYDHLDRCDPVRDLLVAEVDGEPVGYSLVWWDQESDGPRIYRMVCFLDPAFLGRGIGSALVEWNEARLREIAAAHDVGEKLLEAWVNDRNEAATALIRGAGYEPITYAAEMVRPTVQGLADHPLPDGVEIRAVREEDLRTIWEADVEAFRDHWGFVEQTDAAYGRFLAFPYMDTTLWKIAWGDAGGPGQAQPLIDAAQNEAYGLRRGWTEAISTSRRWRRRGLAKALIVESIRELAARGMTEVALGVHTEIPNRAFDPHRGPGPQAVPT